MILRNIPIKVLSTILYGLFGVTSKKKGHHYVKVYFKFVCPAFDHLSPAMLFEEFYCPAKGFQKFGSYTYNFNYRLSIIN